MEIDMESYNQIKVTAKQENSETAAAVMTAMDFFGGLMIEDYSDIDACKWDYADQELLNKNRDTVVISGFVAGDEDIRPILENLNLMLPEGCGVEVVSVEEQDWANNWRKYYKPLRVGKNIVIKPSWESYDKKPGDVIVELDPGMAFGTGTHETTRMCMTLLEEHVTTNTNVLDVGCGSGILSITSMLLGAKSVTGVDIDPVAAKVAVENGRANGFLPPEYTIKKGNLVDEVSGRYEIVVANIIADIIIKLSGDIGDFMTEDGVFICSGIITERKNDVEKALCENGFEITKQLCEGEWVALVCGKR